MHVSLLLPQLPKSHTCSQNHAHAPKTYTRSISYTRPRQERNDIIGLVLGALLTVAGAGLTGLFAK